MSELSALYLVNQTGLKTSPQASPTDLSPVLGPRAHPLQQKTDNRAVYYRLGELDDPSLAIFPGHCTAVVDYTFYSKQRVSI